MRRRAFRWGGLSMCFAVALAAAGQEGHPLTGTWSGDWGTSLSERNHVTLVLDYDGEAVTGLMNPGPRSTPLSAVVLDVTDWTVRIEATGPDGEAIMAEGRIENLESYHRTLSGTWRQGGTDGDFTLTRD